jgi:large subunit ribosomal protein L9
MEVLLKESVEHLGELGDLVQVKPGFARNFLIPKGKATLVHRKNRKSIEKEIQKYQAIENKRIDKLRVFADELSKAGCTVAVQADENDKLYGSVASEDIAKALKLGGFDVSPKAISTPKPIRAIGVFEAQVDLGSEVVATLKVWVVKE